MNHDDANRTARAFERGWNNRHNRMADLTVAQLQHEQRGMHMDKEFTLTLSREEVELIADALEAVHDIDAGLDVDDADDIGALRAKIGRVLGV